MRAKPKLLRWGLIAGYLGIITSMLACMTIGLGTSNVDPAALQIDNGAVEVKGVNGEWRPVAGASALERAREILGGTPDAICAATLIGDVLVGRGLAARCEPLMTTFSELWSAVRPLILGRVATPPRIWRT